MADPAPTAPVQTRQPFQKPDGSVVTLEPQDFQAAQNMGYVPYDPAHPKDYAAAHPGEAFGRGLLRTVSLGASDAVLSGMEGGPKASQQLKEANPAANVGGEVAGFLTPVGAEQIAAKAGKVGAEVAAGAGLGKTAVRAVSGAANGGIWGLGSAISEDTMGDPQQAGEHYAAGVVGGALAGAGANVVLGKAGDLGKSVLMKAFGGKALQDTLGTMAEDQVMRTIATPSDMLKRNMKNRASEVARQALDEGIVGGGKSIAQSAEAASQGAKQAWSDIETGLQSADMHGPFEPNKAAVRMQPIIDQLDKNPAMTEIKGRLQKFADQFIWTQPDSPKTFQKAWETSASMLDSIGQGEPKGLKSQLFKLRGELQDEIFQQANALNPGLGDQLQAANRRYANFASFRDLAGKTATRQELGGHGNEFYDAAGLFMKGPMGLVEGAGINAVRKAARERGGFAIASAMDSIAQNKTFQRIADALQKSIQSGLSSSPTFGGPFRAMLETAAADGAIKLMETHLRLANTEPSYLQAVNMPPETPGVVPEYADKAHRLGLMYQTVDSGLAQADTSIKRFLGGQPGRMPDVRTASVSREDFDKVKQQLKVLQNSNQIDPKMSQVAPNTALAASMVTSSAAKYLLDKAPVDPNEHVPPALRRPWSPGTDELRRWSRCVAAIANPLSVLEQMREGRVTPEALDAVKTVYPKMFADFQDKLQSHLSQMTGPLDRQRLTQANLILENPGDRDTDALIQNMYAASNPQQAPKKPDARQNVDATKNQLTQAQRLEGKNDEEVS